MGFIRPLNCWKDCTFNPFISLSNVVLPQTPPRVCTISFTPSLEFTRSFVGSNRAIFWNALPSQRSAARGASWLRLSLGQTPQRRCKRRTSVMPGLKAGIRCHGSWQAGMPPAVDPVETSSTHLGSQSIVASRPLRRYIPMWNPVFRVDWGRTGYPLDIHGIGTLRWQTVFQRPFKNFSAPVIEERLWIETRGPNESQPVRLNLFERRKTRKGTETNNCPSVIVPASSWNVSPMR